jgi:hypothetical protein
MMKETQRGNKSREIAPLSTAPVKNLADPSTPPTDMYVDKSGHGRGGETVQ